MGGAFLALTKKQVGCYARQSAMKKNTESAGQSSKNTLWG
jgi:hypothetical protein